MICPYCNTDDDKVIDSRASERGRVIRRRRECQGCHKRFTTYERVEKANRLVVVKRDGRRDPFSPEKVLASITAACGKLPIPEDLKQSLVDELDDELGREFEKEVDSTLIGQRVLTKLRDLNKIAYIRFAAEHLRIASIDELRKELEELERRPDNVKDQQALFTEPSGD